MLPMDFSCRAMGAKLTMALLFGGRREMFIMERTIIGVVENRGKAQLKSAESLPGPSLFR